MLIHLNISDVIVSIIPLIKNVFINFIFSPLNYFFNYIKNVLKLWKFRTDLNSALENFMFCVIIIKNFKN